MSVDRPITKVLEHAGAEFEKRKIQPNYLDLIGRTDLKEVLTPCTPWVSVSMEVAYDKIPFTGGMGILAGDIFLQAEKSSIPMVVLTLAYSSRISQKLEDFNQVDVFKKINPEDLGLELVGRTSIKVNNELVLLDICQKNVNKGSIIALYEEGLKDLYYGSNYSEHRLYQEVVLGFGGHRALKKLNLNPAGIHLNESSKVFSAIAILDEAVSSGMSLDQALDFTRAKVILTNHTLVPAAVSSFPRELFENYVFGNLENPQVTDWIISLIDREGGRLSLATLALETVGKVNGVSKAHAKTASKNFKRIDGASVDFTPVTNGIFLERWTDPRLYLLYKQVDIIDEYDLPDPDFGEKIEQLDSWQLRAIKREARNDLIQYLKRRVDQYGRPVQIPQDPKIAVWARRFADYKRPGMIFEDQRALADILEDGNIHLIIAGKAHPTDEPMKDKMRDILTLIDDNPVLRARVHFVQDYNEELARHLVAGADIWLNTPQVGQEACGTSPWKAIANLTRVISTRDGGMADIDPPAYLEIKGSSYQKEVESLYLGLEEASSELSDQAKWAKKVKGQLRAYLSTISGARMLKDYLEFGFPKSIDSS